MSPGRWIPRSRHIPPALLLALALLSGSAASAAAGYQSSVDVNETAFSVCDGTPNSTPAKMLNAAVAAYSQLGYAVAGFAGSQFTKSHTLSRTIGDWGYFVHSHGDYYWSSADGRRYTGFREDSGDCSQQVVFSKDIAARRAGRQSNLVFVSTCHAADSVTTMPAAFAIAKVKASDAASNGPEFYVGYVGVQWDSDEWAFEQRFWNAVTAGKGTGVSFDLAMAAGYSHTGFDADWWGSYYWSGRAGPLTTCPTCV